jgi:plasmid replication initiation protein
MMKFRENNLLKRMLLKIKSDDREDDSYYLDDEDLEAVFLGVDTYS